MHTAAAAPSPPVAVARSGLVPLAGRALLLAAIPLPLVWLPIAHVPGAGTVTAADAVLMALWAAVALELVIQGSLPGPVEPLLVLFLTLAVAVLAAVGAEVNGLEGTGVQEAMLFMKRFGLSAVLPLAAALFATPGTRGWARALSAVGVAALLVTTLRPELVDLLPRPEDWDPAVWEGRHTALLTNPNDLGYAAVSLALLHAACLPRRAGLIDRALAAAVLAAGAVCLFASGSRSATFGAAAALLFVLASRGERLGSKAGVVAAAAVALAVGLSSSTVFQERIGQLWAQGVEEENVSSRLDAQRLAARTALSRPLGVGYSHFARATRSEATYFVLTTADSVYFDTLLGAGFLGLLAFLGIVWAGWRQIARAAGRRARVLQAALVAFLVYGTATIVPISVFLAPVFFQLFAASSYCDAERA